MITINLENVFQSDRGLYHKYSAKTSVVWEMVMLGSYFPIIIWRKVLLNNFLSIFSYHTTSSSAAIVPSPPGLARAHAPRGTDRDLRGSDLGQAAATRVRLRTTQWGGAVLNLQTALEFLDRRRSLLKNLLSRDRSGEGPNRVQVHPQGHVGGYHAEGGTISHWPGSGSDHSNYQLQFWM